MKVYIVARQGVYRHELVGGYETPQEAALAARVAIGAERDDYHDFHVLELELGRLVEDAAHVATVLREDFEWTGLEGSELVRLKRPRITLKWHKRRKTAA